MSDGLRVRWREVTVRRKPESQTSSIATTEFPGSAHVKSVGLGGADDNRIWEFAKAEGFTIVSKDTDFRERSFVEGFPPKIIWLDVGNSQTQVIADLLKKHRLRVEAFNVQAETSMLILSLGE